MRPLLAVNFPREPVPEEAHPPRAGCGRAAVGGHRGDRPLLPRHQVKDDGENQFRAESRRKDGGSSLAARKRFLSGCDPRDRGEENKTSRQERGKKIIYKPKYPEIKKITSPLSLPCTLCATFLAAPGWELQ